MSFTKINNILYLIILLTSWDLMSQEWEKLKATPKELVCREVFDARSMSEKPGLTTLKIKTYFDLYDKKTQIFYDLKPLKAETKSLFNKGLLEIFARCADLSKIKAPFGTEVFNYLDSNLIEKIIFEDLIINHELDLKTLKDKYENLKDIYINKISKISSAQAALEWLSLLNNTDPPIKTYIEIKNIIEEKRRNLSIPTYKFENSEYYLLKDLKNKSAHFFPPQASAINLENARKELLASSKASAQILEKDVNKKIFSVLELGLLTKSWLKRHNISYIISMDTAVENLDTVFLTEIQTQKFLSDKNVQNNIENAPGFGLFSVVLEGYKLSRSPGPAHDADNKKLVEKALNNSMVLLAPDTKIKPSFQVQEAQSFSELGIKEIKVKGNIAANYFTHILVPEQHFFDAQKALSLYQEKVRIWNEQCALFAKAYDQKSCDQALFTAQSSLERIIKKLETDRDSKDLAKIMAEYLNRNTFVFPQIKIQDGIKYLTFDSINPNIFTNYAAGLKTLSDIKNNLKIIYDNGSLKPLAPLNLTLIKVREKNLEDLNFSDIEKINFHLKNLNKIPDYSGALLDLITKDNIKDNIVLHIIRL